MNAMPVDFNLTLRIDWENRTWVAVLSDALGNGKKLGEITGSVIALPDGRCAFVVDTAAMETAEGQVYRGRGVGREMYEMTIRRCLQHCDEFRSSGNTNENSGGVWASLTRRYVNVRRAKGYWVVTRTDQEVLA